MLEQVGVGGENGFRQCRSVHQIHARRNRQHMPRVDRCVLCVTATAQQCTHPIADLPATGRLHDLAGDFQPKRLRRTGRRRIVAGTLQQIGTIDPGRMHADQHLPRRGTRARHFAGVQCIRIALAIADGDCSHRGIAHAQHP